MNNKTKTRSLRVAIIAIALLLCFALAVGVTSALYQARRQATGTLNMDKGIVIDYKGFNKGDENIWQRETTTSFKLFEETNAQPGQEISVYPSGIRANVDSINFYARLKLEYIFYNVANGVETKVDLPNPKSLIKTSNDFFASNWVPSTDGYYYFGENTTLNQFSKDNQNFENLFADGAKFIIEGANFEGETAGEGGGFVVNGTAINKIVVYLTLETLQGDATAEQAKDLGWVITTLNEQIVDITNIPDEKPEINIDDIISDDKKDGEITISGDPKQKLTITIGSKAFYGCSKLKLTLSNSENIEYRIATDAFSTGATIMYGIDNVSSKLINPSTLGHTTVGFDGKWQVSAPGLYLFLPSPITSTSSEYGDFQYTDDQGTWYFDLIDESGNKVDASTLSSTISRNGASTFGASTYANTDNYTAKLNKFEPKDGVTTVVIPKYLGISEDSNKFAVTKIDRYKDAWYAGAFYKLDKLTLITIPDSVKEIGEYAFDYCDGLTSIEIPDSVISCQATIAGNNVKKISIGAGLVNLKIADRYSSFKSLEEIIVSENNTAFSSEGNCLIEKSKNAVLLGCKNSVIPNGIRSIKIGAFANITDLQSIELPNTLVNISGWAFSGCSNLTSISLPNSLTSLGGGCFASTALKSIVIPKNVTSIGSGDVYEWNPFSYCSTLESIKVETGNKNFIVKNNCLIEKSSKTLISAINSSTIPTDGSVEKIEGFAFSGLNISSIVIPSNIKYVENGIFCHCEQLTTIEIHANVQSGSLFTFTTTIENIIYGDEVENVGRIDDGDFTNLRTIQIGAKIKSLSNLNNKNIDFSKISLVISPDNPYLTIKNMFLISNQDGCVTVEKYLGDKNQLTEIEMPNNVTIGGKNVNIDKILAGIFSSCSKLKNVTLPKNLKEIPGNCFQDCKNLESVTIPNSVTSIGGGAFWYCSSLTSITIPESVTSIGNYAFRDCSSLTSITIPDSVTSIGYNAFESCSNLTSVTIGNSVKSIGDDTFIYCSKLTTITIGNSVTSIGDSAFESCSNLTSITIPDSVTSIGWRAFSYCRGLTSITIGNSVTGIGDYAFDGCSGLISIVLPEGLTQIPRSCFAGCTNLESVTIPSTCTTIGNSAFENCSNLTTVIWNISYDLGGVNATGPELSSYTGSQTSGLTMDDVIKSAPTNVESGFTFEGWSDGTKIYQPGEKITFSLKNRKLTAVWSNCRVTFDANGGTGSVDSQIVAKGNSIILPSLDSFTREGYVAAGWSTNKNDTYVSYKAGGKFTPTSNVTLYVVWKELFTITFDANGGTGSVDSQIVSKGSSITLPSLAGFTKEGYVAVAWTLDKNSTYSSYAAGSNYTPTNNVTFYAVWKRLITITIKYNDGVNADEILHETDSVTQFDLTSYSAKVVAPEGKYLVFWYDGSSTIDPYGTIYCRQRNEDIIITPSFKEYETFTFNPNGGDGEIVTWTRSAENKILDFSKFAITREGYVLVGWAQSPDASYVDYYYNEKCDANCWIHENQNIVLYAIWEELTNDVTTGYTNVKFDLNGGTGKLTFEGAYREGDTFKLPGIDGVTKDGYTFSGWSTSSNSTTPSYYPGNNRDFYNETYYAIWSKTITISFDLNGGEGILPDPVQTAYYAKIVFNTGKNFTKEGYKFAGWQLVDGNGNDCGTYNAETNQTFYNNGENYTFKAMWSEPQTITFYNDNTKSQSFTMTGFFDTDGITFPEGNELTKEGYILVGWNTSANSSYVRYSIGQKYSNFSSYTELYAVWKSESEVAKIIFDFSEVEGQENIIKIGYDSSFRILDVVGSIIENIRNASGQAIAGWTWTQGSSNVDEYNDNWIYFSDYQGQTKTLYPVWKNVLTINFDLNGGEGTLPESFEVWERKSFDIPEINLTKDGYMFAGWAWRSNSTYTDYRNGDTNQTFYESDTYGSTTLYAIWKQPLTISFDANGGEGEVPKDIITYAEGRIDIPEVTLTRDGYVFLGWSFNKNPIWDGVEYSNGVEDRGYYQFSSKTLYAVWGNNVKYVFDLNGGEGTIPDPIYGDYGKMVFNVPSSNGFERAGYKFKGWSINPNSSNYEWSSGSSYAYGISGTITMYAVWEVLTDQVYVGSLTQAELDAVQALWNGHTKRSELTNDSLLNSMSNNKLHSRFSILGYLNNTSLEYGTSGDSYYGIGYGTRYFKLSTNSYTFEFENSLPTGWKLVNWRYEVKASGDVTIVNGRAKATIDYTYAGFENSLSEERLMIIFVLPNQPAEDKSVSVSISGLPGNALEASLKGSGSDTLQYLLMSGIKVEIYDAEGNLLWLGKPNENNNGFVPYRFATGTYKIRFYTTNVNGVAFVDNDKGTEVTGMDISAITKGDGYSEFTINYTFAEGNPNLAIIFKMADVDIDKIMEVQAYKDFSGPSNIVGNWFKGMFANMGVAFTDMTADEIKYAGYCGMLIQEYFNRSICNLPSFSIYTSDGKFVENCEYMALIAGVEYTIKFTEEVKEVMLFGESMSVNSITSITYNETTGTWDATFSVSESTMLMVLTADLDLSQYEDLPAYDAATDYSEYLQGSWWRQI